MGSGPDKYTYYQIGRNKYSVERINDTFCELTLFTNDRFKGSWCFEGRDAWGEALAKILEPDEITENEWSGDYEE